MRILEVVCYVFGEEEHTGVTQDGGHKRTL